MNLIRSKMLQRHVNDIKEFIPRLTKNLHKGSCGRIGVVGGSLDYAGAPYFSAMSALRLGADLVYVLCCKDAATAIKSYSPELIVYPLLDDPSLKPKLSSFLERLHSLVIGPGLGRDPDVLKQTEEIINYCNSGLKVPLPLIIDADGLFLVTQNPQMIESYKGPVILTPNAVEYTRLCQKLSIKEADCAKVAERLGGVILKKGNIDTICNGIHRRILNIPDEDITITCDLQGSYRRCGGQGDILSGCTAVFVTWFMLKNYKDVDFNSVYSLSDISNKETMQITEKKSIYYKRFHGFSLACYAASAITKQCSLNAFEKFGRSMTSSDMIPEIKGAFQHHFEMV